MWESSSSAKQLDLFSFYKQHIEVRPKLNIEKEVMESIISNV